MIRGIREVVLITTIITFGATDSQACLFPCGIFGWRCRNNVQQAPQANVGYAPVYAGNVNNCAPCNPCPQPCMPCNTGCNTTVQYVPRTAFRRELVTVPMTVYRPYTTCDACSGCPTTVLRPVTTYFRRYSQVPFQTYRMVYGTNGGCSSCASGMVSPSAIGGCPTGNCGSGIISGGLPPGATVLPGPTTRPSLGETPQPSLLTPPITPGPSGAAHRLPISSQPISNENEEPYRLPNIEPEGLTTWRQSPRGSRDAVAHSVAKPALPVMPAVFQLASPPVQSAVYHSGTNAPLADIQYTPHRSTVAPASVSPPVTGPVDFSGWRPAQPRNSR